MHYLKTRKTLITILMIFIVCSLNFAQAQEKEEKKQSETPPKPALEFSGQVFMNWHAGMTEGNDSYQGNKTNTFELERAVLDWKNKFDDLFSARVTLDVANDSVIEGATQTTDNTKTNQGGSITSKYRIYLKYAFLQAKKSFGPVDGMARVGMIETPVIGFIDGFGDQRWLHKNLIDDAKNVLPTAAGIDNTADAGISLGIDFMKMTNLAFALTNGEGLKNTNESLFSSSDKSRNTSQGKAAYARLGISPVEPLCIFGFYRFEGTSANQSDNHKGYYGAGIAWKDEVFKVGVDYILPFQKIDGNDTAYTNGDKKKMSLFEFWLTINAYKYTQIPSLLMSRYGFGDDFDQENVKTSYVGVGIGYEYSKNIRVAAWYDHYDSEANSTAGKTNPVKVFYVKADIKI
jgi:hypothetical protein